MACLATIPWIVAGLLALAGCGGSKASQLRVTNGGDAPIVNLTVIFPDERIGFGDVPPGATTSYRNAERGVYAYAAYGLEIDGAVLTQPVIDWVGEVPLGGSSFTYTLEVHPLGSPFEIVTLVSVKRED
jgi:hypothetical protein